MHVYTCLATHDTLYPDTMQHTQCVQVSLTMNETVHYSVQWPMVRDCVTREMPPFSERRLELFQNRLPIGDVLSKTPSLQCSVSIPCEDRTCRACAASVRLISSHSKRSYAPTTSVCWRVKQTPALRSLQPLVLQAVAISLRNYATICYE